jgi:translation initiation factor 2-alpha kinase 4
MFSLGVIFFEMFHRFSTYMERADLIKKIRENPPKFPAAFEKDNDKVEIARWLLDHDSSKRPTTTELLQSDMLPAKLEEEILKEAMRTVTIPNTTIFSFLMKRLFSNQPEDHLQYTYDLKLDGTSLAEPIVRRKVAKKMRKIFKKHGGVQFETPMFIPKSKIAEMPNAVESTSFVFN